MLAGVAELVDALDSKSSNSNVVRVRFPPPVQNKRKRLSEKTAFFYLSLKFYKQILPVTTGFESGFTRLTGLTITSLV